MSFTSRELLAIEPGDELVDLEGRTFVAVDRARCAAEGKPGPGRVRIEALPLGALEGQCREWVEKRGFHKASFYFRSRTVRGDHVTMVTKGRFKR